MTSHRLLAAVIFLPMAAFSADARLAKCEAIWDHLYTDSIAGGRTQDNAALLKSWQDHEPTCRGTGAYEFRLAVIQMALGNLKTALELLNRASGWPPQCAKFAALLKLQVQLRVFGAQTPLPIDKVRALKPQFLAAAANVSDAPTAGQQVANYLMLIGDYAEAIPYAERSLKLYDQQWEPNRSLAIAYSHTGNFSGAAFAGRRAQELRNSLIKDPEFMYAVTRGYAGVGNIKVAEMTLAILNQEVPSEHGSKDWSEAIAFIRAQIAAGNRKN